MTAAISIHNLHKNYNNFHALKGVNFEIPKGSFFGLLGPNGAGKSTLINTIAGLNIPTQGSIEVMGHDVQRQWRQARFAVGIVPQELVYDPFFNVEELLYLQSGYFGLGKANRAWVAELLSKLHLSDKSHTNMQALSGGMKRRVLIAQALVHKPSVLVLDEPTAGVDVELRQLLWEFTRALHQQGNTIVLTTHYLEEAEALCDYIAILNHGELITLEKTATLLARHPYRILSLSFKENIDLIKLPQNIKDKLQQNTCNSISLKLHRENDNIGDILEVLRLANFKLADLHTEEPSLEDVFLSLTHRTSI